MEPLYVIVAVCRSIAFESDLNFEMRGVWAYALPPAVVREIYLAVAYLITR